MRVPFAAWHTIKITGEEGRRVCFVRAKWLSAAYALGTKMTNSSFANVPLDEGGGGGGGGGGTARY